MTITIAERLRPFSHLPGSFCLIPTTSVAVQVFPALIRFYDIALPEKKLLREISLPIQGPLKDFTVFQDLERGCVTVVGNHSHYHILPNLEIRGEKNPGTVSFTSERLSLGSHKKQDWEMIKKRGDFREIFPLWFRLGLLSPDLNEKKSTSGGMIQLLEDCRKVIELHRPEHILSKFRALFLAGFGGMLVPRLFDEDFQGIVPLTEPEQTVSPLFLLKKSALLIRSLFIHSQESSLFFLPHLPPEFFAGRMTEVVTPWGEVDFEWTKKQIRRVVFRCNVTGEISFNFPSGISDYRFRHSFKEAGLHCLANELVKVQAGQTYFLDRFQK